MIQQRLLDPQDLAWAVRRLPSPVRQLLVKHGPDLFLAGGFLRSIVANEKANDIDLFAPSVDKAKIAALELALAIKAPGKPYFETENAFSVRTKPIMTQFIHRWTFAAPVEAMESFDFTIAQAALWWEPGTPPGTPAEVATTAGWRGAVSDRFYADLAAKRLTYTRPLRNEDAGGSLLRVLKFYQRGYRIPLDSMGAVVARLCTGLRKDSYAASMENEQHTAKVLTGLLREVDPAIDPDHLAHLPSAQPAPPAEDEVAF